MPVLILLLLVCTGCHGAVVAGMEERGIKSCIYWNSQLTGLRAVSATGGLPVEVASLIRVGAANSLAEAVANVYPAALPELGALAYCPCICSSSSLPRSRHEPGRVATGSDGHRTMRHQVQTRSKTPRHSAGRSAAKVDLSRNQPWPQPSASPRATSEPAAVCTVSPSLASPPCLR